jgi:hypothetical protein
LKRIETQQPVDISTGFFLRRIEEPGTASNGEEFQAIASELNLDHSALLLECPGAKTSDQGVGLFANAANGDKIELITSTLEANKTAAGSFPIAEGDPKWDADAADVRWREHTDSQENPGDRYRQGFMFFDESRADKFDAYKLPFVDIIDGEPRTIPAALRAIKAVLGGARGGVDLSESDKERIGARVDDLLEKAQQNNAGFIARVLNAVKCALTNDSSYNQNDSTNKPNDGGDTDIMKDKILAALNAAGKPTEGLDDDALFAAYNELQADAGKDEGPSLTDTIADLLKPMTEQIAAINTRLDAGPARQKEEQIETIVNSAKYAEFDKDALATMPDAAIATMAANCQTSMSLNSHYKQVDKKAESTLPDGDE